MAGGLLSFSPFHRPVDLSPLSRSHPFVSYLVCCCRRYRIIFFSISRPSLPSPFSPVHLLYILEYRPFNFAVIKSYYTTCPRIIRYRCVKRVAVTTRLMLHLQKITECEKKTKQRRPGQARPGRCYSLQQLLLQRHNDGDGHDEVDWSMSLNRRKNSRTRGILMVLAFCYSNYGYFCGCCYRCSCFRCQHLYFSLWWPALIWPFLSGHDDLTHLRSDQCQWRWAAHQTCRRNFYSCR